MASGLNKATLIGNLGRDPEVRSTQSGIAVCNFSIAVTERRKENDSWKDHTEWFNIVLFGKTAENAGKFLKKGRQVYIDGRLQTRNWQDKEGQQRTTVEVVANQVLFLGGGREAGAPSNSGDFATPSDTEGTERFGHSTAGFVDDDVPF